MSPKGWLRSPFLLFEEPMNRVIALVDGFNYYHRIQDHFDATQENLKWVDYWAVAEKILEPGLILSQLRFFTAIPSSFGKDKKKRHQLYLTALKAHLQGKDFDWIEGNFKSKEKKCLASCRQKFLTWEEKETDVNIAIYLLDQAYQDSFDTCLILSADTDLAPAVRLVKKRFGEKKKVEIVLPPGAGKSDALTGVYGKKIQLSLENFRNNQLPDRIAIQGERPYEIYNPYKKTT